MNKIIKLLNPYYLVYWIKSKKLENESPYLSDEEYIRRRFYLNLGYKPNLTQPITYNEKLNWLKLNYRSDKLTKLVDKYLVREYVKDTIGEEYLIPILNVYSSPAEINFDELPNSFVLKCNHNSGLGMCICKNKKTLNKKNVINSLLLGLNEDFYMHGREWPYKNVKRLIVCEKYLDNGKEDLMDFKLFFFNGVFKLLLICSDRHTHLANDWYDENLNHLNLTNGPKNNKKKIFFDNDVVNKMIALGTALNKDLIHSRIDFYYCKGKIYFGEITLFESSGFARYKPSKWDSIIGGYLKLPIDGEKNEK